MATVTDFAFIFDLDGVIVDTAKYHYLAWKRMASEFGYDLSEEDNEQLKGISRVDSMDRILKMAGKELKPDRKAHLMYQKNEWYKDLIAQMTPEEMLPGVHHFLHEIEDAGIKKALASASKNAQTVLHCIGIENYFDAVVDGFGFARSKPDPEVFLNAARFLEVDPTKAIVFEDAISGVKAANAAGAVSIGVGDPKSLHMANHIISGFLDVDLDYIQTILSDLKK